MNMDVFAQTLLAPCNRLMNELPWEWAHYLFMQQAFVAALILTPLLALLGVLVVHHRMAFFSDAMGHSGLTGIAIGTLCGLGYPLTAMVGFAMVLACAITLVQHFTRVSTDTIISVFLSFILALGVAILSHGANFSKYTSFLIGDILSITPKEILLLFLLALVVIALITLFFNRLVLMGLHESLAQSRFYAALPAKLLFSMTVAVMITISIPWVGILVLNALLILPVAAARNVARNVFEYVWIALSLSLLAGVSGLISSYYLSTATGATIVLCAMMFFSLTFLFKIAQRFFWNN